MSSCFVFVDDLFCGKTIQIGFYLAKQRLRLARIFGLAQLFYHRAHLATMIAVASAALGTLPDALGSGFMLWHRGLGIDGRTFFSEDADPK